MRLCSPSSGEKSLFPSSVSQAHSENAQYELGLGRQLASWFRGWQGTSRALVSLPDVLAPRGVKVGPQLELRE